MVNLIQSLLSFPNTSQKKTADKFFIGENLTLDTIFCSLEVSRLIAYVCSSRHHNLSHLNFTIKELYYRKYSILRIFLYTLKTMNQKLHRQLNFYIPLTTYNRCTCQQLSQKAELVLCSINSLIW